MDIRNNEDNEFMQTAVDSLEDKVETAECDPSSPE